MTRRRRRRGPPKCNKCQRDVLWARLVHSGAWRTFEPKAADTRQATGQVLYPIEGSLAWHTRDLVEDLMVRRQCSQSEAEEEARAMPWHARHVCPTPTAEKETTE